MENRGAIEDRILVLAPTGRDSTLARTCLSEAGLHIEICRDIDELCQGIRAGAGAALIADEALTRGTIHQLQETLRCEPAWSDFPLIVLTVSGEEVSEQVQTDEILAQLGNVTFLERPLRVQTLVSAGRAALRGRRRQYQCRDLLHQQEKAVQRLDLLADIASHFLLTDKPKEIVGSVFKKISAHLGLELYFNYLYDPETRRLWLNSYAGVPAETAADLQSMELGEAICGTVADDHCRIVAENVQDLADPKADLIRTLGVKAYACFPLIGNDELIGTLSFGTRNRSYFDPDELAIMGTICNQVAVAIQRKRTEEALYDLTQQLDLRVRERTAQLQETSEQMEAFCYSISHDLRAPLRTIRGFSQALLEDYAPLLDESGKDFLNRVMAGAEKMDTLIHDLLEYSRLGRSMLTFEPVSLEGGVDRVLQQFGEEINIKLASITVDRPLPTVQGHGPTIDQMITNLISNALKFVTADVPPRIRIRAIENADFIRLWVEDNGIGIAPEDHYKIFGVFERLHGVDAYPGTGIGLAIVAKGVARMGGRTGVESAVGRGSRFWIELPRVIVDSALAAA